MAEPGKDQIKKVQISDVEKPQDDAPSQGQELDHSQLEKVTGGGGYAYNNTNDYC